MRWVAVLAVASAVALCGSHVLNADGQGELWAVLVAGSATWMNYRHQVGLRSVLVDLQIRIYLSFHLAK